MKKRGLNLQSREATGLRDGSSGQGRVCRDEDRTEMPIEVPADEGEEREGIGGDRLRLEANLVDGDVALEPADAYR